MRVPDEFEWHRWFAWYPVVVARDSGLAYWAWLEFVERRTGRSRSTGEWILGYRPVHCTRPMRLETAVTREAGRTATGLTDLGKELIGACNRLRILIDLSHLLSDPILVGI
jgi:hypothetical protein